MSRVSTQALINRLEAAHVEARTALHLMRTRSSNPDSDELHAASIHRLISQIEAGLAELGEPRTPPPPTANGDTP